MKYQLFRYPNVQRKYNPALREPVDTFGYLEAAKGAAQVDLNANAPNGGDLWWMKRFQGDVEQQTHIAILPQHAQSLSAYTYLIDELIAAD